MNIQDSIDEIFRLYEKHGGQEYIGEAISQIEHACQSAQMAEDNGCEEEVILAAFFHDLGHLCAQYETGDDMAGLGHIRHEKIGAAFLRSHGFSERVARLVESHVQAKRYLCSKKPEYYRKLSAASKKTLEFQGGKMRTEEMQAFEDDPLFPEYIQLRAWDEAAKIENKPLPDLNIYREMAARHLKNQLKKNTAN